MEKSVRGRPTKLTDEKIELAIKLRERGFSIAEIATSLGVTEQILYLKNSEWEKLRQRLNLIKSKQELERISKVEKSLFKRSIGYKTKEVREMFDEQGNKTGKIITTKEVPPDVKAQQFFLINRDPDNWKSAPESEMTEEQKHDTTIKIKIED